MLHVFRDGVKAVEAVVLWDVRERPRQVDLPVSDDVRLQGAGHEVEEGGLCSRREMCT